MADSGSRAGAAAGDVIPEAQLRDLLRLVDLEYLVERPGGLRAVVDWGAQLSLGARPAPWYRSVYRNTRTHAVVCYLDGRAACARWSPGARSSALVPLCIS